MHGYYIKEERGERVERRLATREKSICPFMLGASETRTAKEGRSQLPRNGPEN